MPHVATTVFTATANAHYSKCGNTNLLYEAKRWIQSDTKRQVLADFYATDWMSKGRLIACTEQTDRDRIQQMQRESEKTTPKVK